MSEDRPQYQAERTPPTHAEIAERLRDVCAQMLVLSIDMQYVGGFGETAKKGDALALLARHLFVWVHEIEGEAK